MKLFDKISNEYLIGKIVQLGIIDFESLKNNVNYDFDWETEKEFEVYKIVLEEGDDTVLGLMSLIDNPLEYRIHLNLLEVRKEHQGKSKQIDLIAGCLIAFAASEAIKRGYYGFVSLQPKTELIDLYQSKYGFRQYGRYLGIEGESSQELVKKYLGDE